MLIIYPNGRTEETTPHPPIEIPTIVDTFQLKVQIFFDSLAGSGLYKGRSGHEQLAHHMGLKGPEHLFECAIDYFLARNVTPALIEASSDDQLLAKQVGE